MRGRRERPTCAGSASSDTGELRRVRNLSRLLNGIGEATVGNLSSNGVAHLFVASKMFGALPDTHLHLKHLVSIAKTHDVEHDRESGDILSLEWRPPRDASSSSSSSSIALSSFIARSSSSPVPLHHPPPPAVIITIPTHSEHSSLNIAQSVVVVCYEWFKQAVAPSLALAPQGGGNIATKSEWQDMFAQLESYLDEVNYYRVEHKKPIMWQNLQTMLMRGQWSEQELRSFRGMLRSLWERDRKNRPE